MSGRFCFPLLLTVCILFLVSDGVVSVVEPTVFDGDVAKPGKYPWIVYLEGCGGVMISDHVVLTASHCLDGGWPFEAMVGGTDLTTAAFEFYSAKITAGYKWRSPSDEAEESYRKDIGILCLGQRIPGKSWPKLATANPETYAGQKGFVAGWGQPDEYEEYSAQLLEATVPIYSAKIIKDYPETAARFETATMFPAGGLGKAGFCSGDSGGGLFLKKDFKTSPTVLGIVSWQMGFCKTDPNIYASVPSAITWINNTMKKCPKPASVATKPPKLPPPFPKRGNCTIKYSNGKSSAAKKRCSECQWSCLMDAQCSGLLFNGYMVVRSQLPTWECGDGRWTRGADEGKPGLCIYYDKKNKMSTAMEAACGTCFCKCDENTLNTLGDCSHTVCNYAKEDGCLVFG